MKFSQAIYQKIVELVRKRPPLYTCQHREHKDQVLQRNLWNSIAAELGQKDMTGDEWKRIWRQKRDAFIKKRKEVLNSRSNSAATSINKGPLYDQMMFLCDYIPVPRTVSNLSSQSEDLWSQVEIDVATDTQHGQGSETPGSSLSRFATPNTIESEVAQTQPEEVAEDDAVSPLADTNRKGKKRENTTSKRKASLNTRSGRLHVSNVYKNDRSCV